MHPAATRLLNLVRLKLYPEKRLHELAGLLLQKSSGGNLTQNVLDYSGLLDK